MCDQIQQAAVILFREIGEDFTLDQLQQRTGISRATLYRRIGSKEKLLARLADENLIEPGLHADVKSRIYKATRKVVADAGFIACTMEQIASESGLGVATLYRHFGDKKNLLTSFISQLQPRLDIKSILNAEDILLERDLGKVIGIALRFFGENQDLLKILYSLQNAERAYLARIRDKSSSTIIHIARYLERHQQSGALRSDISAEDMALVLNGLLVQFTLFAPLLTGRPLDVERDSETILKLFLQGTQAR